MAEQEKPDSGAGTVGDAAKAYLLQGALPAAGSLASAGLTLGPSFIGQAAHPLQRQLRLIALRDALKVPADIKVVSPTAHERFGQMLGGLGSGPKMQRLLGILGSSYNPLKREVSFGETGPIAIAAHEFGHSTAPKLWSTIEGGSRKPLQFAAGMTVLPGGYRKGKETVDEGPSSVLKAMPRGAAIGTAFGAPALLEEGRASIKAVQALRRIGLSNKEIAKAVLQLGAAFSSYAAAPALGGAAAASFAAVLGRYMAGRQRRKARESQQ